MLMGLGIRGVAKPAAYDATLEWEGGRTAGGPPTDRFTCMRDCPDPIPLDILYTAAALLIPTIILARFCQKPWPHLS
jgi:hypothetical protein